MISAEPWVVVDSGGSGTRIATASDGEIGDVRAVTVSSYPALVAHIRSVCARPRSVAVSLAGFVDSSSGQVRLSRHAPWAQGNLAQRLRDDLGCPVVVMN